MHLRRAIVLSAFTVLAISALVFAQQQGVNDEPNQTSDQRAGSGPNRGTKQTVPFSTTRKKTVQKNPKRRPSRSRSSPSSQIDLVMSEAQLPPAYPITIAPGVSLSPDPTVPAEYLSGEATVTIRGNNNPIIRIGLARSGVTLVEFPASDRFFALHPGNSELVTIDDSPTKQNDHFFVFRAGTTFIPPSGRAVPAPSASIIAQMRSGLVVTFLIYPVRELSEMAHRIVILYDRTDVVASRRASGLAVNLEESHSTPPQRSIRIADSQNASLAGVDIKSQKSQSNSASQDAPADTSDSEVRPRQVGVEKSAEQVEMNLMLEPTVNPTLESEARHALKMALTSYKFKKWTPPVHGISLSTSTPREIKDGSAVVVVVALRNLLAEPIRIVPGQPDLLIETRDDRAKPVLAEQVKKLHIESSGLGNSVPAASTIYYAIIYKRPILGVNQRLRISAGQTNAADDPAVVDLTLTAR